MTPELLLIIMTFIVKEGLPAWVTVSQAWAKQDPTLSDFESLKSMMKRPEDF